MRYLRAHAREFGIDADYIGAIGLSAGGHLTALLATSGGVEELEGSGGNSKFSSTIQSALPLGAQTDLESERVRDVSKSEDKGRAGKTGRGEEISGKCFSSRAKETHGICGK